jgi:hypothetical protein
MSPLGIIGKNVITALTNAEQKPLKPLAKAPGRCQYFPLICSHGQSYTCDDLDGGEDKLNCERYGMGWVQVAIDYEKCRFLAFSVPSNPKNPTYNQSNQEDGDKNGRTQVSIPVIDRYTGRGNFEKSTDMSVKRSMGDCSNVRGAYGVSSQLMAYVHPTENPLHPFS